MLWTSQALVAEPALFLWPHIVIAIFSVSTMASLLTLCVSTHCCRNAKKKENPYGEIGAPEAAAADGPATTVISRSRPDGARLHHPNRLSHPNLSRHQPPAHRLSAPLPQSSAAMKRALPKLPQLSGQLENENPGAIYSTIDRSMPGGDRDGSFLYGEGPANPTYECIDVDPLYSKLENGGPSTRRYDYPIFTSDNRPAAAADDVLYQSASQIYAGVSEDPYSSITSQTGGEANYDAGYNRVRESTNTEPTSSQLSNAQAESRNLDQLYTQIRRGPSTSRAANPSTSRPLPSNEFVVDYISSGSDKTSREPSYRYITVRESVDAIRQRLNELDNSASTTPETAAVDGNGLIREHYYSSIGGGSDYETLQITAAPGTNQSFYDNPDPSTSFSSQGEQPDVPSSALISIDESIPPKPPTSPIPVRTSAQEETASLQPTQPLSSGRHADTDTANDDGSCSSTSERIRKLRTDFFDPEFKLAGDPEQTSLISARFEHSLSDMNRRGIPEQTTAFRGSDRNLAAKSTAGTVTGQPPINFGDFREHVLNPASRSMDVRRARDSDRITSFSTTMLPIGQKDVYQQRHRDITKESRSHSFHGQGILGTKPPSPGELASGPGAHPLCRIEAVAWRPWSSTRFLEGNDNDDEKQSFLPDRRVKMNERTEHSYNGAAPSKIPIKLLDSTGANILRRMAGPDMSTTSLPYPASRSMASLHNLSSNLREDISVQSFSHPQSTVGLPDKSSTESDRSVQIASLSFSHESLEENVQNDQDRNERARATGIDRSWPLISSGRSVLSYVSRTGSEACGTAGTKQYNELQH